MQIFMLEKIFTKTLTEDQKINKYKDLDFLTVIFYITYLACKYFDLVYSKRLNVFVANEDVISWQGGWNAALVFNMVLV